MNLLDARLAPSTGADGLVSRTPGAVLFVASRTPAAAVAQLVGAVTGQDGPTPGHHLARQMATLVGADSGTLPGFALVAASAGGVYVKAYGPVEVRVQGDGGEELISGVGSFTGVDRELAGAFHTIVAHRAGEPTPAPAFDVDVRSGTAPGGGFALTTLTSPTDAPITSLPEAAEPPSAEPIVSEAAIPIDEDLDPPTQAWSTEDLARATSPTGAVDAVPASEVPATDPGPDEAPAFGAPEDEPVTAPPAAPATGGLSAFGPPGSEPPLAGSAGDDGPETLGPESTPAFTSQLLGALDDQDLDSREALPVELDPGEVRAPDQSTPEVMVQGVLCSRGHFNDPRSRFCSSCGISMVQNTQVLTPGPRPPLGVMVFEDGATFSVAQDYVIGRQPEVSELVRDGLALPLPVDDPERSISRAHAELRLVDWDVHLINLSATNGSFVWDETQQQWIPIPTGQSVLLCAGMRVALGRRSAVFESSLVR